MYVFTGKLSGGPIAFVRYYDLEKPDDLPNVLTITEGDMAHVSDDETGSTADYISVIDPEFNIPKWHRFDPDNVTTFSDMIEINKINNTYVSETDVPSYANKIVRILDAGNGKEALFVCTSQENMISYPPIYYIKHVRIGHFNIENIAELNTFSEKNAIQNGDIFTIEHYNSEYVSYNGEFIQLNSNLHELESKDEIFDLIQAQTGDIVEITENGRYYIFSGKNWLTPGNEDLIVSDITEMNNLSPDSGDIVYVVDADNKGNPGTYLFSENQWIPFAKGKGSDITIYGKNLIMNNSNISSSTFGHGNAANISLIVDNIEMNSNASIKSESTAAKFGGSAGTINIDSNGKVKLIENSSLSTSTLDAGGGKVFVNAQKNIYLFNGEITSSVKQGAGEGGDIDISSKNILLNHASITANADEGDGGAIFIVADVFIKSSNSIIEATSERGNDGTVKIEAPDIDVTKDLIGLTSELLDAVQWLKTPCAARTDENCSSIIVKGRDASPARHDDFLASPLVP